MSSSANRLTSGNIKKQILMFAIPILLSSIFQQLYNATNSIIVGNYVSKTALSAISATNSICNIYNFLFYGLGTGAGIVVATYFGASDHKQIKRSIDTAIIFAIVGGLILTIISELAIPFFLEITNVNKELYAMASSYLRVYFIGNVAVFLYQMGFFILRSLGDSKNPLYFLILSSIINIILGIIFVRVLDMSVTGTALATIISQFIVDILVLRLLFNLEDNIRLDLKNIEFDIETAKRICSLGIPAGIQNMMIAISSMMIQSYINQFPNEIIAGIGVAERINQFAQIPMSAISTTTVNMVSQNMVAKNYDRAKETVSYSVKIATLFTIICSAIVFISAPFLVSLFNNDMMVISSGATMIRYMIFGNIFIGLSHVYHGAIRGSGNVKIPMINAVVSQCIVRYLFVYIGLKMCYDVRILYVSQAVGFSCAGIVATIYFYCSNWTKQVHLR